MNRTIPMYSKIVVISLLMFIFILFISTNTAHGEEDDVFFYDMSEESNQTSIVYRGEHELGLMILFGNNCSNWSLQFECPLFDGGLQYFQIKHYENITAGRRIQAVLNINDSKPLGIFPTYLYLNYTDDLGNNVSQQFLHSILYGRAYFVIDYSLPTSWDHEFSLTIRTFFTLTELEVHFDSDGDIGLENESYLLKNVPPGDYNFSTRIFQLEDTSSSNTREVGYHITGHINGRNPELSEKNIEIS